MKTGRPWMCVVLGLTAFIGLMMPLSVPAEADAAVLEGGALWALAACALAWLFAALGKMEKPFAPVRLWGLAALFAGVMVLGGSFAATGTAEGVTAHRLRALTALAGRTCLYFALMRLLLGKLCAAPCSRQRSPLRFGALLLLCWLPWAVCLFPGTVSNDSLTQLKELLGVIPFSNGNPIVQTGLVGLFSAIGLWLGSADLGVALYCLTQAVLLAWLLGALLHLMQRGPGWLVAVSFVFYAFCPIFPVFAFCVGKDTNFAMAVLFLCLMVWRVSETPQGRPVPPPQTVLLCLAAVLCTLLRNPGVFLALLTLALLLLWALRCKQRGLWLPPACALGCVLGVYLLLHLLVIPQLHIAPMPETENYSLPLQQVARVAAGNALTPQEKQAVDGVLVLDELKAAYNGELSDPVKNLWRENASAEQKRAFWHAWPRIVLHNPATALSATFHNTYGYLYPGYVSQIKPTLLIGDQSSRTANVRGLYDYSVNPLSEKLKALTNRLLQNPLYRVLIAPGLYGWICLFAVVCLTGRRRMRCLVCTVPALFTLAGCLLSAVNGYFRYAMPLYLCAPFLLWVVAMAASARIKEEQK